MMASHRLFAFVSVAAAVATIAVTAACGGSKEAVTEQAPAQTGTTAGTNSEKCDQREFGHIDSLVRKGDHYELRFDPAWFTSGVTANTAAAEDGAVEPGQPVPNDNYVVEEGHRLLTYLVRDDAHVTVLTSQGDPAQFGATPITVSELAEIVQGKSSLQLLEPLESGVWIRYAIDTVCSLDQQYRP